MKMERLKIGFVDNESYWVEVCGSWSRWANGLSDQIEAMELGLA
jgi:hypothetical protein